MRQYGILSAVVIGASLVLAAVAFALIGGLLRNARDTSPEAMLTRINRDLDAQTARFDAIDQAIEALRSDVAGMIDLLTTLSSAPTSAPIAVPQQQPQDQFGVRGAASLPEALVEGMGLAEGRFNQGIERPRNEILDRLIGQPRETYSDACQTVTNPKLLGLLETRQIGSFRVTMVRPALDSLQQVLDRLRKEEPQIHAAVGTAGALCPRHVRGTPGTVSSHAWGMAIDLTLSGNLDRMGDGSTQFGLIVMAEYFNEAGWYWGGDSESEDSMHFEVGEALLRQWAAEGKL